MKLIMATSADGFICRDEKDDMSWTGPVDKAIFKLLTLTGSRVLGAGRKTYELMPKLPNRKLICISNHSKDIPGAISLGAFIKQYPDGWLIGGQTLARHALGLDLIKQVVLVRTPCVISDGVPDSLSFRLNDPIYWTKSKIKINLSPHPSLWIDIYARTETEARFGWGHEY